MWHAWCQLSQHLLLQARARLIEIYNPQHPEIHYWVNATGAKVKYSFLLGEGQIGDYHDKTQWAPKNRLNTIV